MIKLAIKTLQQKTFSIEVEDDASIQTVKHAIEAQEGFSFASQLLIFQGKFPFLFSGKILDDSSTISACNIKEKDFLVMMVKKKTSTASPVQPVSSTPVEAKKRPETIKEIPPLSGSTTAADASYASEHELEILILMEMGGFDRDIVVKAMKAAFNNPDRAAEYLFSGNIPEPSENDTYGLSSGGRGLQSLSFLKTDPQFLQLRALLNRQPHLLQPLLQQIGSVNPRLLQAEFLSLLEEGNDGDDGEEDMDGTDHNDSEQEIFDDEAEDGANDDVDVSVQQQPDEGAEPETSDVPAGSAFAIPHTQYIQVSSQEKEAIDRLVDLGFARQRAIEAFFACDKDESLAANYLFDNPQDDGDAGVSGGNISN